MVKKIGSSQRYADRRKSGSPDSSLIDKEEQSKLVLNEDERRELLASVAAAALSGEKWKTGLLRGDFTHEEVYTSISSPGKNNLKSKLRKRLFTDGEGFRSSTDQLDKENDFLSLSARSRAKSVSSSRSRNRNRNSRSASTARRSGYSNEESAEDILLRLSRQVEYGRRVPSPIKQRQKNRIKLHVYDLIPQEMVIQFPWGCYCPIGRCFGAVNSSLHSMGTGAYHVGVEVNGIEYAYGACEAPSTTGVFSCVPMRSPGYQYRTTIDFGSRALVRKSWITVGSNGNTKTSDGGLVCPVFREVERFVEGRDVIKEMASEYMGEDYDLFRKNCVTFSRDVCLRLGVEDHEIPTWFRNLAESGAMTQDAALSSLEPIQNICSTCDVDYTNNEWKCCENNHPEGGFEVVTKRGKTGLTDVVVVVDSADPRGSLTRSTLTRAVNSDEGGLKRALSWTY